MAVAGGSRNVESESLSRAVPQFLQRTYAMVNDPALSSVVRWTDDENGFTVLDEAAFVSKVLPANYRTRNILSFVRQLNFYGFSKRANRNGTSSYYHSHFRKGHPEELALIHRKVPEGNQSVKQAIAALQEQVSDLQKRYEEIWNLQNRLVMALTRLFNGQADLSSLLPPEPAAKRQRLLSGAASSSQKALTLDEGDAPEGDDAKAMDLLNQLSRRVQSFQNVPRLKMDVPVVVNAPPPPPPPPPSLHRVADAATVEVLADAEPALPSVPLARSLSGEAENMLALEQTMDSSAAPFPAPSPPVMSAFPPAFANASPLPGSSFTFSVPEQQAAVQDPNVGASSAGAWALAEEHLFGDADADAAAPSSTAPSGVPAVALASSKQPDM
jgi:hypothetical protein